MIDISTDYLGLRLRSPLVVSASPLSEDVSQMRRLEDAGAAAIVLYSLFAEELEREQREVHQHLEYGTDSYAESLSYFPQPANLKAGPDHYLEHVRRCKEAVAIPVIASLNGSRLGHWIDFARQIEEAGADALELNLYAIPTDFATSGEKLEAEYLEIVRAARNVLRIPLAVKLSPYFSSLPHFAGGLAAAGADALVLFNRFYQPDINLESLEVEPHVQLSTAVDLRLPLRWIAILFGRVDVDWGATGGLHSEHDVLKLLMAGANVTMLCSVLLKHGIQELGVIETGLKQWMENHEYKSVRQMRGSMSQLHCTDPAGFERAQYFRALHSHASDFWLRQQPGST